MSTNTGDNEKLSRATGSAKGTVDKSLYALPDRVPKETLPSDTTHPFIAALQTMATERAEMRAKITKARRAHNIHLYRAAQFPDVPRECVHERGMPVYGVGMSEVKQYIAGRGVPTIEEVDQIAMDHGVLGEERAAFNKLGQEYIQHCTDIKAGQQRQRQNSKAIASQEQALKNQPAITNILQAVLFEILDKRWVDKKGGFYLEQPFPLARKATVRDFHYDAGVTTLARKLFTGERPDIKSPNADKSNLNVLLNIMQATDEECEIATAALESVIADKQSKATAASSYVAKHANDSNGKNGYAK